MKPNNFTPGNGFAIAQGLKRWKRPIRSAQAASFTLHSEAQSSYQSAGLREDACSCLTVHPNTSARRNNGLQFKQKTTALPSAGTSAKDRKCGHKQTHRMDYAKQNKPRHDDG